jgi:hypothetical protein
MYFNYAYQFDEGLTMAKYYNTFNLWLIEFERVHFFYTPCIHLVAGKENID